MTEPIVHRDTHRTADRLPPGQNLVDGWPVLTAGAQPVVTRTDFRFRIFGQVENPCEWSWAEFTALPARSLLCDMHCVTTWSRFRNTFRGVLHTELLRLCRPTAAAKFVMIHGHPDYSTNVPMADFARDDCMFAWEFDGKPLAPAHGGPVRGLIPHLYLWKSAKWASGVEFMADDRPGFWEERGYHMRGDPWREERYRDDREWRGRAEALRGR
ncbi:MAG: sulfite oxidase-like oxidoreductase [Candidatus Brocadiae bacterium]|nr:sulfite oxidase-like oxidoreductase [Candidatus Brocadiia bacterium]